MDSGDILSAEQASERRVGMSATGRPKPSPRNQRRRGRSSLRYRFMLLQLGISACLMGLMLYLAAAERRVAMEAAEARVVALASLAAQGESWIENIYQIDRGHESIETHLSQLGANITRVTIEKTPQTLR